MKKGDLVFVYGTLRKGETSDLSIQSGAEFVGTDTINGLMYGGGWYPKLKPVSGLGADFDPAWPVVHGEVYKITDDRMPRHLDAYEGYPNLYDRMQVESSHSRFVWVYVYNGEPAPNELIPGGDWVQHKNDKAAERIAA